MKFQVYRASKLFSEKTQPCEDAYEENGTWFIDINSLEELKIFFEREGELIIGNDEGGFNRIIIYDDYLE